MLNPLVREGLASVVRAVLQMLAGWLIANGLWTSSDADKILPGLALAIVSLVWSVYQKARMRNKLVTAMAMPSGVSENQVQAAIRNPFIHTPPITLAKDEAAKPMAPPEPPLAA